ncbi:arsenate reductase ArsC [Halomonas sp. McH1-25]|uniref:arsenate-mycothiol transferase ArsC n=1 Tax=unclassified Halomonas TaxID=2609666 RepID=UPI001EF539EA|nr:MULTISPECIES: arsenate reductase ArsC [unclassified Halomonas]MCG7599311.1 arsenate reductase ArsC [Halomonas sp. McH1-25]MCP1341179.1 arsenate reductase ArsC [Halomonas sp. FL8]MCP1362085.1 arsenate reductase ArsC [Halomonas sp. BBD45]MCP1366123.1 arsenate reductase ArsC [Halomonas sp. BBD48]
MAKQSVLFVGDTNSERSLMGEAMLRHMSEDHYDIYSAGITTAPPEQAALDALVHAGIDTTGLVSEPVEAYADREFDFVIILSEKAQQHHPEWKGKAKETLFWDITDPRHIDHELPFQQTLQEIHSRLTLWLTVYPDEDAA